MSTLRALALALAAPLAFALAAPAQAQGTLPEGKVAIHYNRCDNSYDGWGVHIWKDGGTPAPGVEWTKPMMPSGKDDFGVFWQLTLADYGASAKVNYIIHKGDTKDQNGKDMAFDGKAMKEIWVNNGDGKIYGSEGDAKAARAATPCK